LIFPVEEIIRRAREKGIPTVIDGAHGPGQVDLNLEALGVDFYAGNCHKWLMSPKGAAFLYVRPEYQRLIEPLVVSWGDKSLPGSSAFIQENEFQGTRDIAAFLSVPAAIRFREEHHWVQVQQHCHKLALLAYEQVPALTGLPPLSPPSQTWFRQMAAFPLPPCDGAALQRRLYDEFSVEIPVFQHNGRQFIRVSVQGYNTRQDVERFLEALEIALNDAKKFSPQD
jgi:isopenicillin-N epimerase